MLRLGSSITYRYANNSHALPKLIRCRFYTNLQSADAIKPKLLAREYQLDCVTAILQAFDGRKRAAVSLPTGSGKTVIFSMLIPHVKPVDDRPDAGKTLIIVPRREIAKQAVQKIQDLNPGLRVGLEMATSRYDPDEHDVCVATYQSLARAGRLNAFDPEQFKLIVVDEAHKSAADSIMHILAHFDVLTKQPKINLVGFSATLWRNDDRQLNNIFDDVVFHRGVNEMIDEGHLSKALLTNITGAFDLQNLSVEERRRGRTQVLRHKEGLELIVRIWKETWPTYKSTLVFALDLNHVADIVSAFRREGIDARSVDSLMHGKHREEVIQGFASGEFPVLVNYSILSEGTDIPRIDQIILARSLQSELLALQMVGRGLRKFPGKEHCNIVQFAEMSRYDGSFDMASLLENFADDLTILEKSGSLKAQEITSERAALNDPRPDISNVSVTAETLQVEQIFFTPEQMFTSEYSPLTPHHSPWGWIEANKQYYLFPATNMGQSLGYLRIGYGAPKSKSRNAHDGDSKAKCWILNFVRPIPGARHPRSDVKFSSPDLSQVIKHAEKLAKTSWPYSVHSSLHRHSEWRSKPATKGQLDIIRNRAKGVEQLDEALAELSRGDASSLISLKFIGFQIKPQLVSNVIAQARRNCNKSV